MAKKNSKNTSTALMWTFTIVLLIGLFMTIANLHGKCLFSKYDGVIMSFIGIGASIAIAVTSNKSAKELFTGVSDMDY